MKRPNTEKDFWDKVDIPENPNDCWEWQKCKNAGYGLITYRGEKWRSHRLSYVLTNGAIPGDMWILHHCDNRSCVNPDHLYIGTAIENGRDTAERNRIPKGERSHLAKISQEGVENMRSMYASGGCIQKELAVHFGISHGYVNNIINMRYRATSSA